MATQPNIKQAGNAYTISNSKAFITRFLLSVDSGSSTGLVMTYPKALTGSLDIRVNFAAGKGYPSGWTSGSIPGPGIYDTNGDLQVEVGLTNDGDPSELTFTFQSKGTAGGGVQLLPCTVTVQQVKPATGTIQPQLWTVTLPSTAVFVACDPQAEFTVGGPGQTPRTADEQQPVTLSAAPASAGGDGTSVIGTLPAELGPHYRWNFTGQTTINGLPATTTTNTTPVTPTGVAEQVTVHLTLDTCFGPTPETSVLTNSVAPDDQPALTIGARAQHVVFVLDQSGSMGEDGPPSRYDNAKLATQMFTHLLVAAREGVDDGDRVGIVTFTDDLGWHATPVSSKVKTTLGLTGLADARKAITDPAQVNFGAADANTPIGDGLVAGLDLLASGGTGRPTLVLLTDGFENAGTVYVGKTDPGVAGVISYGGSLGGTRDTVKADLKAVGRQFVIPLGDQVDSEVLSNLAGENGYVPVTDPKDLAKAFGDILQFSQDVLSYLPPTAGPSDPAVHFSASTTAHRVFFAVLGAFAAGHTVKVESLDPATGTWVTQSAPVVEQVGGTDQYQVLSVPDYQAIPGGQKPVQWRVTHLDDQNAVVTLPADHVLAFGTLHLKADATLDNTGYLTGDDMNVTMRIRNDDQPVRGATVTAQLVAPQVGAGEALSTFAPTAAAPQAAGADSSPLGRLIGALLRKNNWPHWPRATPADTPSGLFVDGTDQLHDVDGDGVYTNTFARVWKEGNYTWTLTATGNDTAGEPFTREVTLSTFAGIKVDPKASKVKLTPIFNHPSHLRAVRITVTPQDVRHERLGPGKDKEVFWELENGVFEHVYTKQPAPVFTDGTYQRVVLYRWDQRPAVQVLVEDVQLPEIDVPFWILQLGIDGVLDVNVKA